MAITFLLVTPNKLSYVTGEAVSVLVHLTGLFGSEETPVQGANVQILLDNVQVGIGRTSSSGYATVNFAAPSTPGIYTVVGNYYGGVGLDPATASNTFSVTQGTPTPPPMAIPTKILVGVGLGAGALVAAIIYLGTRR